MEQYVGLDVSLKETSLCVVDRTLLLVDEDLNALSRDQLIDEVKQLRAGSLGAAGQPLKNHPRISFGL